MIDILISIIGIILTIFIIVGIHEFGHFIVARAVGIKVLRFSIGFGKTLFHWHDKKGTEYVIAALPLGGYVKMLDTTEGTVAESDLPYAYNQQPFLKKCAVIIAGPLTNFLLAFLVYWFIFMIGFQSIIPVIGEVKPLSIAAEAGLKPQDEIIQINQQPMYSWSSVVMRLLRFTGDNINLEVTTKSIITQQTQTHYLDLSKWRMDELKPDPLASLGIKPYEPNIPAIIGKIDPDSPAYQSYLKEGDRVIAINHKQIHDWLDVIQFIAKHPSQVAVFKIERNKKVMSLPVAIDYKRNFFLKKRGYLGLAVDYTWPKKLIRLNQYAPLTALYHAKQDTIDLTNLNFILVAKIFTGKVSLQSLGGPITIFESAGNALHNGILPFFAFLAFLSIAIGVINILPIPGLDGGHLLINTIEQILRRPLSTRALNLFYRLGFIVLMLLIVQALVNDIQRLT